MIGKFPEKLWQINWDLRYKCSKYIEWQKEEKHSVQEKKKFIWKEEQPEEPEENKLARRPRA